MSESKPTHETPPAVGLGSSDLFGVSRKERKFAANYRRKNWRLSWLDMMQGHVAIGGTMREAVVMVANDAAAIATKNPTLKSEVMRALDDFTTSLRDAIIRTRETSSPNDPKLSHDGQK